MTDDIDLIERVKTALENHGHCPWLPHLTLDLAECRWRVLYEEAGLSPSNYGTSRAILKNVNVPLNVVAHLSTSWAIEILDESLVNTYEDSGIAFYTAKEITSKNLLSSVEDAINLIQRVPSLQTTMNALIKSLHLIKPTDDEYDISFSEPNLPFSIFVSVPPRHSSTTAIRIAEAVVHEAMHLQLTLVEQIVRLVIPTRNKYFSPWREEYRTAQGLLHALYVFRVIDKFLERMLSIQDNLAERFEYIQRRRDEIDRQINGIRSFSSGSDLTMIGACFVQNLIQGHG